MNKLIEILEKIYNDLELRKTVVPLFISNPGQGKSEVVEQFAKSKGVNLIEIIGSQILPYEISGMAMPTHEDKKMTYYDFDKLSSLKEGDVLFFDEILTSHPNVLTAMLTLIGQRRTISGKQLPNILIVAASNPQGQPPLYPAIKERFVYYDIKFDKNAWKQYMSKFMITDEIFEQLCVLIQNESFNSSDKNYYTPRSIVKAIKMIIADIDTPYATKLKPILNNLIENTSENDIQIGEYTFKKNEKISWLKLQKMIKYGTITE